MNAAKELRIQDYLRHILQAINQIEIYTVGVDQQNFFTSQLLQDAVIRNLEIIGEAANNILKLDSKFTTEHPEMSLKAAYAMRNALSHGYFNVDPLLVWGTVHSDLPRLKPEIVDALNIYTRS